MACIATALALAALTAPTAHAEDWWAVSSGFSGPLVKSDASTLACHDGKCSIWELTTYPAIRRDGVLKQKDLADYDCIKRLTSTRREISYNAQGDVVKIASDGEDRWQPLASETVGEASLTFACNFLAVSARGTPAATFSVDHKLFVRVAEPSTPAASAPSASTLTIPVSPALQVGSAATLPPKPSPNRPKQASAPSDAVHRPLVAQIAAAPTMNDARGVLKALVRNQAGVTQGLTSKVETAFVHGRPVYRAVIYGFPTGKAAERFCRALRNAKHECFVRSSP